MGIAHAMVVLPAVSNIPKDTCVNTFHFLTLGTAAEGSAAISSVLKTFYSTIQPSLSSNVAVTSVRLKVYDEADPQPRAPVYDAPLGLTGSPGTGQLAPELAICSSFQGARVSGVSQARRRGRVYIGPLATAVMTSGGIVATANVNQISTATKNLVRDCNLTPNIDFIVWSRVTGGEGGAVIITNGWVDNAFDVQRRRGFAATSRTLWQEP